MSNGIAVAGLAISAAYLEVHDKAYKGIWLLILIIILLGKDRIAITVSKEEEKNLTNHEESETA